MRSLLLSFLLLLATLAAPAQPPVRPHITGISHAAYFVSDLPATLRFWHDLLGFDIPYTLNKPGTDTTRIAFIKINDHQRIELFNEAPTAPPNHMSHLCFLVDDLEAMRVYLRARGVAAPANAGEKTRAGDYVFTIQDPDGTNVEFCQNLPGGLEAQNAGKFLPASRISTAIYHVGFLAGDSRKSLSFYRDILGFRETWRGAATPEELSWINLQLPDGDDYIELMLYRTKPDSYGGKNHISLVVPDVQAAIAELRSRPAYAAYGKPLEMHIGKNGKRQVNLFDPDGTRVELMEAHTADGKAVPPSTAPPPTR